MASAVCAMCPVIVESRPGLDVVFCSEAHLILYRLDAIHGLLYAIADDDVKREVTDLHLSLDNVSTPIGERSGRVW